MRSRAAGRWILRSRAAGRWAIPRWAIRSSGRVLRCGVLAARVSVPDGLAVLACYRYAPPRRRVHSGPPGQLTGQLRVDRPESATSPGVSDVPSNVDKGTVMLIRAAGRPAALPVAMVPWPDRQDLRHGRRGQGTGR